MGKGCLYHRPRAEDPLELAPLNPREALLLQEALALDRVVGMDYVELQELEVLVGQTTAVRSIVWHEYLSYAKRMALDWRKEA